MRVFYNGGEVERVSFCFFFWRRCGAGEGGREAEGRMVMEEEVVEDTQTWLEKMKSVEQEKRERLKRSRLKRKALEAEVADRKKRDNLDMSGIQVRRFEVDHRRARYAFLLCLCTALDVVL